MAERFFGKLEDKAPCAAASLQRDLIAAIEAFFHRTRDADEREALFERYLPLARSLAAR